MSVDTGVLEAKTIRMAPPPARRVETPKKRERKITPTAGAYVAHPGIPSRARTGRESLRRVEEKTFSDVKAIPGVSVFAVLGTLVVAALMLLVVLAQINYNETANEAAMLNSHLRELTEHYRTLELAYESSYNISEVERIARDELGMSRPDAAQMLTITTRMPDTAVVITDNDEIDTMGFVEFIKSLTAYFNRK